MDKFVNIDGLKPIKVFLSAYAEEPILVYKKEEIDRKTAADVAPVVHGHWIKTNLMFASSQTGRHGNVHVCSNCGEQSGFGFATPYCAICGAKMDEEEQDE